MRIEQSVYDEDVFFIGFDGELGEETLKKSLERNSGRLDGSLFEIRERRDAEAPDTNTDEDLETFGELRQSYDHVEYVRVRVE
jgi:hypothetical protein